MSEQVSEEPVLWRCPACGRRDHTEPLPGSLLCMCKSPCTEMEIVYIETWPYRAVMQR